MQEYKKALRSLVLLVVSLLVLTLFTIHPIYARYKNTTHTSAVFGYETVPIASTLTADTAVYDFGCWNEANSAEFADTIHLYGAGALSGTLRLQLDTVSAINAEIVVLADGAYDSSNINSGYSDYRLSAADGHIVFPFYLLFGSRVTTDRVATLDVSWYPDGSNEPTLFAHYFWAMNPLTDAAASNVYFSSAPALVSPTLLRASLYTPAQDFGVMLGLGSTCSAPFARGTRYYIPTYPQGVTLLRDSPLCLERQADVSTILMNLSAHTASHSTFSVTAGVSATAGQTASVSTAGASVPLSVSLSDPAGVVSMENSLTVTLSTPAPFTDGAWNAAGSEAAQLTWQLQRLSDGVYTPISPDAHLTMAVQQTADGGTLTIGAPTGIQPAGTYRLILTMTYDGYVIAHTKVDFFIDYR